MSWSLLSRPPGSFSKYDRCIAWFLARVSYRYVFLLGIFLLLRLRQLEAQVNGNTLTFIKDRVDAALALSYLSLVLLPKTRVDLNNVPVPLKAFHLWSQFRWSPDFYFEKLGNVHLITANGPGTPLLNQSSLESFLLSIKKWISLRCAATFNE